MLFLTILAFIIILSFLFFTHEFGHFLAAKRAGVPVLEFGFGFPPRLFKWKKGETVYSINLIPFGAFVNILGLDEPKNKTPASYWNQSVWRRLLIAFGGILANFFWAWLILTISLWIYLVLPPKNFVLIQEIAKNSPASTVGIQPGDILVKGDGQLFKKAQDVVQFTKSHKSQEVTITIERFGKQTEKKIKLSDNTEAPLGVGMADAGLGEKVPFWQAPFTSFQILGQAIYATALFFGKTIGSIFVTAKVPAEITGPVGIWGFVAQFTAMGFLYLLRLLALLSLALGFTNLLPLPALDGGRIIFLLLEKLFGKKVVNPETENMIHGVGFMILIGLSILIAYKDILRLMGK